MATLIVRNVICNLKKTGILFSTSDSTDNVDGTGYSDSPNWMAYDI